MAFLPLLLAWVIASEKKYSPALIFSSVFLMCVVIFFGLHYFVPSVNLPQLFVQKQQDFLGLGKANTSISIHPLLPNLKGFLINAPQALNHTLLRPHPGDYSLSRPLIPFIIELIGYQVIFILFLFFPDKTESYRPFIFFCIFFSLALLLIIGYTVPVLWAIVRYRSIYLPFLLTPVICAIDYKKIFGFVRIKK